MDGHDCELTQSLLFIQFQYIYIYTFSIYVYTPNRIFILIYYWKRKFSIMYMYTYILLYASILNINVQGRHVHYFLCPLQCFHIDLESPSGHNQRKGGQGNWWGTVFLGDTNHPQNVGSNPMDWLVVWNMFFLPNWLIFFRGVETTNQMDSLDEYQDLKKNSGEFAQLC